LLYLLFIRENRKNGQRAYRAPDPINPNELIKDYHADKRGKDDSPGRWSRLGTCRRRRLRVKRGIQLADGIMGCYGLPEIAAMEWMITTARYFCRPPDNTRVSKGGQGISPAMFCERLFRARPAATRNQRARPHWGRKGATGAKA